MGALSAVRAAPVRRRGGTPVAMRAPTGVPGGLPIADPSLVPEDLWSYAPDAFAETLLKDLTGAQRNPAVRGAMGLPVPESYTVPLDQFVTPWSVIGPMDRSMPAIVPPETNDQSVVPDMTWMEPADVQEGGIVPAAPPGGLARRSGIAPLQMPSLMEALLLADETAPVTANNNLLRQGERYRAARGMPLAGVGRY